LRKTFPVRGAGPLIVKQDSDLTDAKLVVSEQIN
jgi:hypothetical protein